MKTMIHIFSTWPLPLYLNKLHLPKVVTIDRELFDKLQPMHGQFLKIDIDEIYCDRWSNAELNLIIPDFAKVKGEKLGFYLEQSQEMINLRDSVKQCTLCNSQFHHADVKDFCPYCIDNLDIPETDLYKTFLRHVSTLDIEVNHKSIYIPGWLKERRERIPQLTESNGHFINI